MLLQITLNHPSAVGGVWLDENLLVQEAPANIQVDAGQGLLESLRALGEKKGWQDCAGGPKGAEISSAE